MSSVSGIKSFLIQRIFCMVTVLLFLSGCDEKAQVNIYKPEILKTPIPCLQLIVSPSSKKIAGVMQRLYIFKESCPYKLTVSYKNGITCNSTFNVQTKTVNGFPKSYLNMEIRKGFSLQYSYYIDLMEDVTPKDIKRGFDRIKEDLHL